MNQLTALYQGTRVTIRPVSNNLHWGDGIIRHLRKKSRSSTELPKLTNLKPLSAELLYGAMISSQTISEDAHIYNCVESLYASNGAARTNRIYYGIINGRTEDLQALKAIKSSTTVTYRGVEVEAEDLLYAYLMVLALSERIRLLCNRMSVSVTQRWLRRFREATATVLIKHHDNVIASVGDGVKLDARSTIKNVFITNETHFIELTKQPKEEVVRNVVEKELSIGNLTFDKLGRIVEYDSANPYVNPNIH